MEVVDAIRARRALRVFDPRPIETDKVEALVEAMRLSPSCFNNQPWRVVLVRSKDTLDKVKEALTEKNAWATRAAMIMVVAAKPADDCRLTDGRDYYLFGCGMAVGEMMLRATELGLIAHPIAGYDPHKVKEAVGIPNDYVVITIVNCGYPGTDDSLLSAKQKQEQMMRPARLPLKENFFLNAWGTPFTLR